MPYRVQITDTAVDKLEIMQEPSGVAVGLLEAIECDLGSLERLNGYRAVAPVRFHTHRVVYHCPVTGDRRKFLLWVDDCYSAEATRVVLDFAEITTDEPYLGIGGRMRATGRHLGE